MSPIRIGGIIDSRAPTYGMKSIRNVIDAHRNTNGISMNERTIAATTACPKATEALVTTYVLIPSPDPVATAINLSTSSG